MDERMVMTYLVIDLFCLIIALTMCHSFNDDFGCEFEVMSIRKSVYCYCGFMLSGLLWLFMENEFIPMVVSVVWIANMCSLFLIIALSYYWFLFALTHVNKKVLSNFCIMFNSKMPVIIAGLMCITTPLTGWVFTISSTGVYSRGPLLLIFSSFGFIYDFAVFGIALVGGIREKHSETRKICFVIALYVIFPLIAGILQLVYSGMPVLAPAIVTGYFLVFNIIRSSQINNDALTGLYNRRSACRYLNDHLQLTLNKRPITLFMLDLNSFKKINDSFGHVEGDRALKIIAVALNKVAEENNVFVARYGGDEFMIISRENSTSSVNNIIKMVRESIAEQIKDLKLSYKFTISIGYACNDNNMTAEQLIEKADHALYKDKESYYQSNSLT